jgi:hypothetical protein
MNIITNNPYRQLGLLVGTTAVQFNRHTTRMPKYIEADEKLPDDFIQYDFNYLGNLQRSKKSITDAASKLNLDADKIFAAIFWFYKGNEITDEPAFDLLSEGNVHDAVSIWAKLTNDKEVDAKNASAYQNLSTLLLHSAINDKTIKEDLLEKGLRLKLKFLNSDFVKDFKVSSTDSTFKITKSQLQLMLLTQITIEIEKKGASSISKLIAIINNLEFSAKELYFKDFVQNTINLIEQKIESTKSKRKSDKSNKSNLGNNLNKNSSEYLDLLKSILGNSNLKFISLSDKLAEEIFFCGFEYFKELKESENENTDIVLTLYHTSYSIAVDKFLRNRILKNITELQNWIKEKPKREKERLFNDVDLEFVEKKRKELQDLYSKLSEAKKLPKNFEDVNQNFYTVKSIKEVIDSVLPRIPKIKKTLAAHNEIFLELYNSISENAQGLLVLIIKNGVDCFYNGLVPEKKTYTSVLVNTIKLVLETMYLFENFEFSSSQKSDYQANLNRCKSTAKQYEVSILSPKQQLNKVAIEKLQQDLEESKSNLNEIKNKVYFQEEIIDAKAELIRIKDWHFLRTNSQKEKQILFQQTKIDELIEKSEKQKAIEISFELELIEIIKKKLKQFD